MLLHPARGALLAAGLAAAIVLAEPAIPRAARAVDSVDAPPALVPVLSPTIHPPVARDASALWLAPTSADRSTARSNPASLNLLAGLKFYAQEKYDLALQRFASATTSKSPLRDYAAYYAGVSALRLQRFEAARSRFAAICASRVGVGCR